MPPGFSELNDYGTGLFEEDHVDVDDIKEVIGGTFIY